MRTLQLCLTVVFIAFSLSGCVPPLSATEALWLDDSQVSNAIKLREVKDPKLCLEVMGQATGSAPFAGIQGGMRGVIATGKHMDMIDCMEYLFGQPPPFDSMRKKATATTESTPTRWE